LAAATLNVLLESSTSWPVPTAVAAASSDGVPPNRKRPAVDAALLLATVMFSTGPGSTSVMPVPAVLTWAVTPVLPEIGR